MKSQNISVSRVRIYFFLIAFLIGLIHTWLLRHAIDSDGIPYLDIADKLIHGDEKALVNGIWSPLYAIIIGFFFLIFKPNPYLETTVVHFANFLIFLFCFFSFDYFLQKLIQHQKTKEVDEIVLLFGYTFFIWTSMNFVNLSVVSPDLLVTGFIFLASGILLKITFENSNFYSYILLGIVLALGYLSKTAMFFTALTFIGLSVFAAKTFKMSIINSLITLITFSLISSPFITLLSKSKGYFTYGEVGKLNYHWYANSNVCECFRGGFPNCNGKLVHPVRTIFNEPTVFEFASPFQVTYPITYDGSYWCDGTKPYFDLRGQIRAILASLKDYFNIFLQLQGVFFVFLILFFLSQTKLFFQKLKEIWFLIFSSVIPMGIYALVHVESRYISAYLVIFFLLLFSVLKLPKSKVINKFTSCLFIVLIAFMLITSFYSKDLEENHTSSLNNYSLNSTVAQGLKRFGIQKGDKVAVIGVYDDYIWARLAKVYIVSEIPSEEEINKFWASDNVIKKAVLNTFKNTGAKIIISGRAPTYASKLGWKNIEDTSYYVYIL